ncbi:hypothetical protein [Calothrix sp. 336/3]|uniref:hypothetical protein n=1 Tax=Calothrix sp. 336/3 TaxID=1337936 RepID=UPI000AD7FF1B|nr:hypothetical protein [Calothrix sp. 336/3]
MHKKAQDADFQTSSQEGDRRVNHSKRKSLPFPPSLTLPPIYAYFFPKSSFPG